MIFEEEEIEEIESSIDIEEEEEGCCV